MWTLLGNIRDRKPDIVCSFCPFVSSFYFLPSPVRWQRPRVNKKFATQPPSPNPIEPLERNTPHCKPPPTFRRPIPLHTHAPLKTWYNTPFVLGDDRGQQGWTLNCPSGREVWVHGTPAPFKPLYRRETGTPRGNQWSFCFWRGKKKKFLFSLFLELWHAGVDLKCSLSVSHHHSQQLGGTQIHSGTRAKPMLESGTAARGTT